MPRPHGAITHVALPDPKVLVTSTVHTRSFAELCARPSGIRPAKVHSADVRGPHTARGIPTTLLKALRPTPYLRAPNLNAIGSTLISGTMTGRIGTESRCPYADPSRTPGGPVRLHLNVLICRVEGRWLGRARSHTERVRAKMVRIGKASPSVMLVS